MNVADIKHNAVRALNLARSISDENNAPAIARIEDSLTELLAVISELEKELAKLKGDPGRIW